MNLTWHNTSLTKQKRASIKGQKACVLWFTGLSASGKSTLANALELRLFELNCHTYLLDGDNLRLGLNKDLSFDEHSRTENIRRLAELCKLFVDSGLIVLSAFISPFKKDRDMARALFDEGEFIEIFVDTPLELCEQRDPKGLYKKARNKEIDNFTGISSPYERPQNPQIHITDSDINKNVEKIITYLKKGAFINA